MWETPIKRIETPIKRIETPIECGKRPSSVGKRPSSVGNVHRAWGNVGALPRRGRGVPGRCRRLSGGGLFKFSILGKIADEVFLNCLDLKNISIHVGGTGVTPTRILISRPHDGGVSITRDGDETAK